METTIDRLGLLLASCILGLAPLPAWAGIHTWDVSEVFSNADGTIQFIELKETNGGNTEGGVGNGSITSNTQSFSWSNGTVSNTANKFYLVATQGFADLAGAPTPDAIIDPGSVPFFDSGGDAVSFVIYDTCTFGPVPTDGVTSFDCLATSTGVNTPTNFAGDTGSVDASLPTSITLNHVDDFQDGTLQNWAGGSNPVNQPSGGPDGVGDAYLELEASGGFSFLGTFNAVQWSGDYLSEGVGLVELDVENQGPDPVSLRIMLFTPGCDLGAGACTAWASTNATILAAGSGWVTASFSLDEVDLTRVLGADSYASSLQNVERLLIRHDAGAPDGPGAGEFVDAVLGIDNVTALPEPSVLAGLLSGAMLFAVSRRGRRSLAP